MRTKCTTHWLFYRSISINWFQGQSYSQCASQRNKWVKQTRKWRKGTDTSRFRSSPQKSSHRLFLLVFYRSNSALRNLSLNAIFWTVKRNLFVLLVRKKEKEVYKSVESIPEEDNECSKTDNEEVRRNEPRKSERDGSLSTLSPCLRTCWHRRFSKSEIKAAKRIWVGAGSHLFLIAV